MSEFVISGDKLQQTVSIFTFPFYSNFSGSNACALWMCERRNTSKGVDQEIQWAERRHHGLHCSIWFAHELGKEITSYLELYINKFILVFLLYFEFDLKQIKLIKSNESFAYR